MKVEMKKNIILFMVLVVSVFATDVFAADLKIAVFDAQKVIDNIGEAKNALEKLDREAAARKKEIDPIQKEVAQMKKDLDSQALVLSKEALQKKQMELQQKFGEYQKMAYEAETEFQEKHRAATAEIFKKINALIQKIGKDSGYDFVFEKNSGGVTYFKSGDITDKVIQDYNKTYKVSKTKKPLS